MLGPGTFITFTLVVGLISQLMLIVLLIAVTLGVLHPEKVQRYKTILMVILAVTVAGFTITLAHTSYRLWQAYDQQTRARSGL